MRHLIVIIFSLICFSGFSQSRPVATIPSPRGDSAFAEYGYLQSLVLGIDAVGDTMIRPRLAGSSRTWIHGGVTEVWKWDGTKWVITGTSGGAGGGTVTNVSATNTYALSWVITNPTTTPNLTGTLDTALLLTQNHFYNSIDSLILTFNSSYVKYTDTASMLSHYVRRVLAGTNVTVDNTNPQYPIVSSTAGGGGTVTSVALAAPSIYTVSGSPVTTSGTLTFTPNNAQGDLIYGSATNTLAYLNKSTTANSFLKNSGTNNNPAWATLTPSDIPGVGTVTSFSSGNLSPLFTTSVATETTTPALSYSLSTATAWRVFSTNASTTPAYNQLKAEHLNTTYSNGNMLITDGSGNLSWTTAGITPSDTAAMLSNYVRRVLAGTNVTVDNTNPQYPIVSATGGSVVTPAALTKTDDTNVTLTLGGTPSTALLQATSLTLGWTGALSLARGGTNNGSLSATNGGLLYMDGTKVVALPIGATNQQLGVIGGIPAWRDTLPNAGWLITGNAGTTAASNFIGTTDAISFRTRTNNVERMIVDSVGLVGIGQTVPTAQLHVVSTATGLPALGAELLSASGWTSTNWTGSFGAGWTHTSGNTTALTNSLAAVNGTGYYITLVVSGGTAGTFTVTFGGVASNTISGAGTFDYSLSAISTGTLSIAPTSAFDRTIVISIKAITGNSTPISIFANSTSTGIDLRSDTLFNVFVGKNAGARTIASSVGNSGTTGTNNTGIGYNALTLNVSGNSNSALGHGSMAALTYGTENTAIGMSSMAVCTSCGGASFGNVAVGYNSASGLTTGTRSVAVGEASMGANASNAVAVGGIAGNAATNNSTYLGYFTAGSNTGSTVTVIGALAGTTVGTFASNNIVAVGYGSLNRANGAGNVGLGYQTLSNGGTVTHTGTYNTALGFQASYNALYAYTGSYNVTIGAWVKPSSLSASGLINISNVLYGINGYQTAVMDSLPTATGSIGIGVMTPTARLMLPAGTATASTAPLKFTAGTILTTPESGVVETNSSNELYYSTSTTTDTRGFVNLGRYTASAVDVTATANMNTIDLTVTGKTATLPTAVGIQGRIYTIKLTASGTGTVATTSSQTIDGSTTYSLASQYKYVTVQSNNANWIVIANN